ncbi:MAG: Fur family transcriptional regulator [Elusimicrobiota bacterium]|nr:Fur family transcriptional regulator [Elusimicrobiota bacterium]
MPGGDGTGSRKKACGVGRGCGQGWGARMRGMGCRMTVPRRAIFETVSNSSKHLSAEDIYMEIHQKYPAVGLTTVYRTLELLVNTGSLIKHEFGEGRARYEYTAGEIKEHAHLICLSCGRVQDCSDVDIEKFGLDKISKEVSSHYGFDIKRKRLVFHGLCKECVKRGEK